MVRITGKMMKELARGGQLLAFLAVLLVALNPHPLHAQMSQDTDHNHVGFSCESLEAGDSSSDDFAGSQSGHGDCIHHFDSMVGASTAQNLSNFPIASLIIPTGFVGEFRLTSDPPPPRRST